MMKKILLLSSALTALTFSAGAQGKDLQMETIKLQSGVTSPENPSFKSTSTNSLLVKDTLHYYLNKFYFKTATTQLSNFPSYVSAAATVTNVTHVGSRFDVPPGDSIVVTGLEAFAQRVQPAVNLFIPIHMMLCTLDAQGMPVLPPIDSVQTGVSGNAVTSIGGPLTQPRTMKSDFAILFRNVSTSSGDYARLLRTAGSTQTNVAADPATKCSDTENGKDYGYVRFMGNFYSTRDFTLSPGFGHGTQYEFVVAPRVEYLVQASQILPSFVVSDNDTITVIDTVCTRTEMVYTNTSSKFFEHRMYNLNQFYRKWNLYWDFPASVASVFESDSSITWNFEFFDDGSKPDSRVFLPYVNNGTISVGTDLSYYPYCFTANQFRARLKPMGALGRVPQLIFNEGFKVCFRYCNGDTVGLKSRADYESLRVYPNPAIHGKTLISGLKGKNAITVYNMIGQAILTKNTEEDQLELNLVNQPLGTYLVRIVNSNGSTKTVKIIKQE